MRGNVYVADQRPGECIRKIDPAGVVTTLGGLAGYYGSGAANGAGSTARFSAPRGVALDNTGQCLWRI